MEEKLVTCCGASTSFFHVKVLKAGVFAENDPVTGTLKLTMHYTQVTQPAPLCQRRTAVFTFTLQFFMEAIFIQLFSMPVVFCFVTLYVCCRTALKLWFVNLEESLEEHQETTQLSSLRERQRQKEGCGGRFYKTDKNFCPPSSFLSCLSDVPFFFPPPFFLPSIIP